MLYGSVAPKLHLSLFRYADHLTSLRIVVSTAASLFYLTINLISTSFGSPTHPSPLLLRSLGMSSPRLFRLRPCSNRIISREIFARPLPNGSLSYIIILNSSIVICDFNNNIPIHSSNEPMSNEFDEILISDVIGSVSARAGSTRTHLRDFRFRLLG